MRARKAKKAAPQSRADQREGSRATVPWTGDSFCYHRTRKAGSVFHKKQRGALPAILPPRAPPGNKQRPQATLERAGGQAARGGAGVAEQSPGPVVIDGAFLELIQRYRDGCPDPPFGGTPGAGAAKRLSCPLARSRLVRRLCRWCARSWFRWQRWHSAARLSRAAAPGARS